MEVKNYAIIDEKSNLVVNVCVWDGEAEWAPDEGYIAVQSDIAGIGWSYDPNAKAFSAPEKG